MLFRDIIGHDDIKQRLIRSVQTGQIAHAQLFAGPEGVGKFQLALAYARYIQCTNRGESDSCGTCPSCVKYNKVIHPDIHFVYPIINKKTGGTICADFLPQWRDFLQKHSYFSLREWLIYIGTENQQGGIFVKESDEIIRKLSVKSYESEYKIMIIWLPEKMNEQTSNKLLKLLEEPFEKTIFLLVSNEPDMLLSTIQSRAQRINVRPLDESIIAHTLQYKFNIIPEDAVQIAHLSNGIVLRAIESLEVTKDQQYFFELFVNLMRLAYGRKLKEMKAWSEEVAGLGRELQKNFLTYAQRMIRENFILNLRTPELNYMTKDEMAFSQRFSPFVNTNNTMQIMEELDIAERHIGQNVNSRIVFFDLSLKFIMLLKNQ